MRGENTPLSPRTVPWQTGLNRSKPLQLNRFSSVLLIGEDDPILVIINTLANLLSKSTRLNISNQEGGGSELLPKLGLKDAHDGEDCVEANKISEGERTHGHVSAELHGGINILTSAQTLVEGVESLKEEVSLIEVEAEGWTSFR